MAQEIELNPVDFITIGTVGPKGRRVFHLQAGHRNQLVTLTIEKEQSRALAEAIAELLDDLSRRFPQGAEGDISMNDFNMNLRDPIDPDFRIGQIGLGYDETHDRVVIVAQELVLEDDEAQDPMLNETAVARFWGTRAQFRALSKHTLSIIKQGRANPRSNGRLIYYWT